MLIVGLLVVVSLVRLLEMSDFKTPVAKVSGSRGRSFSTAMKSVSKSNTSRAFTNTAKKAKDTSLEKEAPMKVLAVVNSFGADNNNDNIKKLFSLCETKGIEGVEHKSNAAIYEGNRYVIIIYSYLICI